MIEILPGGLNMDCYGQNLHFVQKYLCFILLRGDLNICGCEMDEKCTRLRSSSMDVLPSKSSSQSCDWKLWIIITQTNHGRQNQLKNNYNRYTVDTVHTADKKLTIARVVDSGKFNMNPWNKHFLFRRGVQHELSIPQASDAWCQYWCI